MTQACIDGISDSAANMQAVTAPWSSATESLATSGAGELQRLRYVIADFLGLQYWYRTDRNIDFASTHSGGTIQGNGVGRHVAAVALHTWAGSNLWPAITSVRAHQSGIMWGTPGAIFVGAPAANGSGVANHMTVMIDATDDQGRFGIGQTNARTWYSFHAAALTLHHTAALRFAHSQSMMGNGQYGHVTAIRISRALGDGSLNNAGFQEGNDQLIFGHLTATTRFEGVAFIWSGGPTAAERMRLTSGGVLAIGTTVTASALAGDVVLPGQSASAIRSVDVAGTGTIGLLGTGFSVNAVIVGYGTGTGLPVAIGVPASVSGAGAGDLVLTNNTGEIRGAVVAGNNTYPMLVFDSSNQTSIGANSVQLVIRDALTQTTIGANGAASALTANPVGYLTVSIGGSTRIIPYYNP